MKALILFILFFSLRLMAQPKCDDQGLIANAWVKHSSQEFTQVAQMLEKQTQNPSWVKDIETAFFSGSLEKIVSFKSLDNLETPDMEMFGDVAYYSDSGSRQLLEIRWYQDGKKHFVLHTDIPCTVDEIPLAENALF